MANAMLVVLQKSCLIHDLVRLLLEEGRNLLEKRLLLLVKQEPMRLLKHCLLRLLEDVRDLLM